MYVHHAMAVYAKVPRPCSQRHTPSRPHAPTSTIYARTHARTRVHTHSQRHTHTHTHTRARTCTPTHTRPHTPTRSPLPQNIGHSDMQSMIFNTLDKLKPWFRPREPWIHKYWQDGREAGRMHYWASIHSEGTNHGMHDHPEHSFAGVYYSDVPKHCSGPIMFYDPRAAPINNPDHGIQKMGSIGYQIMPKEGDMVIWPVAALGITHVSALTRFCGAPFRTHGPHLSTRSHTFVFRHSLSYNI